MMDASDAAILRALPDDEASAHAVIAARNLSRVGLGESLVGTRVEVEDKALQAFLVAKVQNCREERLHVVFADAAREYICDEGIAVGELDQIGFSLRGLVERALDCGARSYLLAHNHPSGCPTPSEPDIAATRRIVDIGEAMDLEFIDHLIVARGRIFSMRQGAML